MRARAILLAVLATASLTVGMYAQGAGRGSAPQQAGNLVTGAWGPVALKPDARGWGWMSKSYLSANAQRPLYNQAKEKLFADKQVTSVTISEFNSDQYCEARKHWTTSGSRCSTARCRGTKSRE